MRTRRRSPLPLALAVMLVLGMVGLGTVVLALLQQVVSGPGPCATPASVSGAVALGPPGTGVRAGATEYGGPGDPSSGTVGASGANLLAHPDSYAELGGLSFQTATMLGGLPYMTPLRIT